MTLAPAVSARGLSAADVSPAFDLVGSDIATSFDTVGTEIAASLNLAGAKVAALFKPVGAHAAALVHLIGHPVAPARIKPICSDLATLFDLCCATFKASLDAVGADFTPTIESFGADLAAAVDALSALGLLGLLRLLHAPRHFRSEAAAPLGPGLDPLSARLRTLTVLRCRRCGGKRKGENQGESRKRTAPNKQGMGHHCLQCRPPTTSGVLRSLN